jgi:hypothetical protein
MSPLPLASLLVVVVVLPLLLPLSLLNNTGMPLKRLLRLAPDFEQVLMLWSGVAVPSRPRVEAQEPHLQR